MVTYFLLHLRWLVHYNSISTYIHIFLSLHFMKTPAKPFYTFTVWNYIEVWYVQCQNWHAQNNEFCLSSLHSSVHLAFLSFRSNFLPRQVSGFQSPITLPVPYTMGRLVSSMIWKHQVPVAKQKGTRYHRKPFHSSVRTGLERAVMTREVGLRAAQQFSPMVKHFHLGLQRNFYLQTKTLLKVIHSLLKWNLLIQRERDSNASHNK